MSVKAKSTGRGSRPRGLTIATCLAAAIGMLALQATPAFANGADSYFDATRINQPGQTLQKSYVDEGETVSAYGGYDFPEPGIPGGEPTGCAGDGGTVNYNYTVWYEFHPHLSGELHVTVTSHTTGFRPVVSMLPYDPATNAWSGVGSECEYAAIDGVARPKTVKVSAGSHYKIQIGGETTASDQDGNYRLDFTYDPDSDGDGVLDSADACPNESGPAGLKGCSADSDGDGVRDAQDQCRTQPTGGHDANHNGCADLQIASAKIKASFDKWYRLAGGRYVQVGVKNVAVRLTQLEPGTKLTLSCSRHACRRHSAKMTRRGTKVSLLRGAKLRKGTKITVRATRPGFIGRFFRLRVKRDLSLSSSRCTAPGSSKAESCKKINTVR